MCNRYANLKAYYDYLEMVARFNMRLIINGGIPNLEPRDQIRPTDMAPILRQADGGLELVERRWGLIPHFHKRGIKDWKVLTTNARLESVATTPSYRQAYARRRCLVPFSHFHEWSGPKNKRTMWAIAPRQIAAPSDDHCFAGIWDRAETADGPVESFSLLTRAAGRTMQPYHDRQPVILPPEQCVAWLENAQLDDKPFDDLIVTEHSVKKAA